MSLSARLRRRIGLFLLGPEGSIVIRSAEGPAICKTPEQLVAARALANESLDRVVREEAAAKSAELPR